MDKITYYFNNFNLQPTKIKIIVFLVIFLFIVFALLMVFSWQRITGNLQERPSGEVAINQEAAKLNLTEVSEKSFAWINKQRDNNKKYLYGYKCNLNGSCDTPIIDNRAGLYTIWANFKSYQKNKDPKKLDQIREDLATYADPQMVKVLQMDHWSCKLMYELHRSDNFNEQDKDKIRYICFASDHFPVDYTDQKTITDEQIIALLNQVKGNSLLEPNINGRDDVVVVFTQYATTVSDFITQNLWDNEVIYYQSALLHFREALKVYSNLKDRLEGNEPLIGIAALDIYRVNNKPEFLNFAKSVYSRYQKQGCNDLNLCMHMAFLADELYKVTAESKYKSESREYIEGLKNKFYDYPGQEAFYFKYANKVFAVRENSLILGLINSI